MRRRSIINTRGLVAGRWDFESGAEKKMTEVDTTPQVPIS